MLQNYNNPTEIKRVLEALNLTDPEYKTEILEIIQFLNENQEFLDTFGSKSLTMLWKCQKLIQCIENEN